MKSTLTVAAVGRGAHVGSRVLALAAVLLSVGVAACGRTSQHAGPDLTLAFAARTAIVNDPLVGAAPIDIQVQAGVVTLHGLVASAEERTRAVQLVQALPGVARVDDQLAVSTETAPARPAGAAAGPAGTSSRSADAPSSLVIDDPSPPGRHFAIGGTLTVPTQTFDGLSGKLAFGPAFRLGRGGGWHPAISWTRVRSDLPSPGPGAGAFGQLRMSAVAVGIGHELTRDRWSIGPSVLVGYAFNHVRLDPGSTVPRGVQLPVAASGAPAALAGATLWIEASRRVSVGFSSGYLFCRPDTTWIDGDRFIRRRLNADVWLSSVSVAYWVF